MATIHIPDDLHAAIEQQVAHGHASTATDFVQNAVLRQLAAEKAWEAEVAAAAERGIADIEAGRYTTLSSGEDFLRLTEDLMRRIEAEHPERP